MREYEVIGLFESASRLLTNDLILLPEADLKVQFDMPDDRATDLMVEVYNPTEVDNIAFKITELLTPILEGWSTLFPAIDPAPRLDPYALAVLLLLTVVPYIVATIVPSWQAAITDPDPVMRTA
jgi:ABC-type lipoprotein release transport system permease subunit